MSSSTREISEITGGLGELDSGEALSEKQAEERYRRLLQPRLRFVASNMLPAISVGSKNIRDPHCHGQSKRGRAASHGGRALGGISRSRPHRSPRRHTRARRAPHTLDPTVSSQR